jgi:hypothetical protein
MKRRKVLQHVTGLQNSEVEWHLLTVLRIQGIHPWATHEIALQNKDFLLVSKFIAVHDWLMRWESHWDHPRAFWRKIWMYNRLTKKFILCWLRRRITSIRNPAQSHNSHVTWFFWRTSSWQRWHPHYSRTVTGCSFQVQNIGLIQIFLSSVMHRYKVIKSLCSKCWRNLCVDEYFEKVMVEGSFDIYSPQLCAVFVCLPVLKCCTKRLYFEFYQGQVNFRTGFKVLWCAHMCCAFTDHYL